MTGKMNKYDNFLDRTSLLVSTPDPYEKPKSLGFNLRKANDYAKKHNIKIADIPLSVLKMM